MPARRIEWREVFRATPHLAVPLIQALRGERLETVLHRTRHAGAGKRQTQQVQPGQRDALVSQQSARFGAAKGGRQVDPGRASSAQRRHPFGQQGIAVACAAQLAEQPGQHACLGWCNAVGPAFKETQGGAQASQRHAQLVNMLGPVARACHFTRIGQQVAQAIRRHVAQCLFGAGPGLQLEWCGPNHRC